MSLSSFLRLLQAFCLLFLRFFHFRHMLLIRDHIPPRLQESYRPSLPSLSDHYFFRALSPLKQILNDLFRTLYLLSYLKNFSPSAHVYHAGFSYHIFNARGFVNVRAYCDVGLKCFNRLPYRLASFESGEFGFCSFWMDVRDHYFFVEPFDGFVSLFQEGINFRVACYVRAYVRPAGAENSDFIFYERIAVDISRQRIDICQEINRGHGFVVSRNQKHLLFHFSERLYHVFEFQFRKSYVSSENNKFNVLLFRLLREFFHKTQMASNSAYDDDFDFFAG